MPSPQQPLTPRAQLWRLADRCGALASLLCAVHCAALPLVLLTLPALGLGLLADHRFEQGFVGAAAALATLSLGQGFRRHRHWLPLRLAVPGLALLLSGITVMEHADSLAHAATVTLGGLLLALAHRANLRLDGHASHAANGLCVD